MSAKRLSSNVVVVGAWNPAIISPPWLSNNKVVEELPKELQVELGLKPSGRIIKFELGGVQWKVTEDKLEIHGKGQEKDCGVFAARVLLLLPHTPIGAIGSNFVFESTLEEWPDPVKPYLGKLRLGAEAGHSNFRQVQWSGAGQQDEHTRLSIVVAARLNQGVQVTVNFHRNVQSVTEAVSFAGLWAQDRDTAAETLKELFEVEVV